jgi:hypothetical protein
LQAKIKRRRGGALTGTGDAAMEAKEKSRAALLLVSSGIEGKRSYKYKISLKESDNISHTQHYTCIRPYAGKFESNGKATAPA